MKENFKFFLECIKIERNRKHVIPKTRIFVYFILPALVASPAFFVSKTAFHLISLACLLAMLSVNIFFLLNKEMNYGRLEKRYIELSKENEVLRFLAGAQEYRYRFFFMFLLPVLFIYCFSPLKTGLFRFLEIYGVIHYTLITRFILGTKVKVLDIIKKNEERAS